MTMHSTMGVLYTISEGLQGESPSISPQSEESATSVVEQDSINKQDGSLALKNGTLNKGKTHPRLAQLRGQIQAQVRELSPRNQMIQLVDKVTHVKSGTKVLTEGNKTSGAKDSTKLCHCSSPTCFASELEGRLHVELTALRLEVKSSLESLRTELGDELRALHRDVKVCCHHCPANNADHSKAIEKRPEWKSVFKKVSRKEGQEPYSPVRLDGQIKARSVPSLAPQSGPSRNHVLLKAMTTIAAKNALMSSIGQRSDSDPVLPSTGKQQQKHKTAVKAKDATAQGQCNGNWGRKLINGTVVPLPQNGIHADKAH
ncbi:Hypothetical predicted protein [Pelobates cultripes]|uniref:Uncharacterized protein n=1 Tax=Pelobates cultripes TaxID=61616 RepID=A0AAD1S964_PELCU|nr:Hypothetical predicted protein [Pelobates cultripes]